MRTWVRVSLAGVGLAVLAFAAFAGMSSYVVLRHMEMRSGTEAEAVREFDEIKKRFAGRQPLVEMTGPQARDIRINRLVHPQGSRQHRQSVSEVRLVMVPAVTNRRLRPYNAVRAAPGAARAVVRCCRRGQ